MTTDQVLARLSTVRFPIRLRLRSGREYRVDRREGISVVPRAVHVVRDGFDVVVSIRELDQVLDGRSSR